MTRRHQTQTWRPRMLGALVAAVTLAACSGDSPIAPDAVGTVVGDAGPVVAPPAMPIRPMVLKALIDNGNGTFTYTQDVTSGYAFSACRYGSQDSGWQHTFPGFNQPGRTVMSVKLTIVALDVDAEPYHGWYGEYDGIFVDGTQLNPGYLQGSNDTWSTTVFDVPASRITDDGVANVWVNIDMHNTNSWCTRMGRSTLEVEYQDGPVNHPPYQPELLPIPSGAPDVASPISVTVVGPTPPDPDGHAVTYSYRWFLNTGTGGFLDPQIHGRGIIAGNTVPPSATQVNDEWRVEVTPRDELGAVGDYAVVTFPRVTPVLNHPPVPVISLDRGITCPDPYLEGRNACVGGGGTHDPDQDVSTLAFHWDYGDGTTLDWVGVEGTPPHLYVDDGTYLVTLTVTDDHDASASTQMEVMVGNAAPVVDAGPDQTVDWGLPLNLTVHFTDLGVNDADWAWTIEWGNQEASGGITSDQTAPIEGSSVYLTVGTHTVNVCVMDKDGGLGCDDVTVQVVDPTPPIISFASTGKDGDNGWFVGEVTLVWTVIEPESPGTLTTEGCGDLVQGDDGEHAYTCKASSAGGGNEVTAGFKIDRTPPTVTYGSHPEVFDIVEPVFIPCTAADATSGIAVNTCMDVVGAAWEFGLGTWTFSAMASDNAGNQAADETSFTVKASFGGLCSLVELWVDNTGVANSLCAKLNAAGSADTRGNYKARDGSLNAFINEVGAQSGKKVPADKAPLLILFAQALMA